MTRSLKVLAVLTMILTLAAGCRATTGRSLGTGIDDRTTHASIKTRLAADRFQNLTWVGVDVSNGIATLTGNVESDMQRERAESIARGTAGVRGVVNNLLVTPGGVEHAQDVRPPAQAGMQPAAQPGTQQQDAVQRQQRTVQEQDASRQRMQEQDASRQQVQADPAASPAAQQVLARQTMNAEVRDINRATGHVRLDTPEGRMDLNVPQETARTLHEGDRVTVEMVIRSAR